MEEMTIRRMEFAFTPEMERVFVKNDPAASYTFLGAWMMLPYLEPYLIRTMRQALPKIRDEQLKYDLKRFCAQEGEHFKHHAKANKLIRELKPEFAVLSELEAELDAEYKIFSKEKPLKFNLAYAEGFESMTSSAARAQFEVDYYDRTDSPLADLAKWHVMEELEHRSVAFDVYEHVVGSYPYRLRKGIWAQKHYFSWVKRMSAVLRAGDADIIAQYQTPEIIAERKAYNRVYHRKLLPKWLATYMPWYDPSKVSLPQQYEVARKTYSDEALKLA